MSKDKELRLRLRVISDQAKATVQNFVADTKKSLKSVNLSSGLLSGVDSARAKFSQFASSISSGFKKLDSFASKSENIFRGFFYGAIIQGAIAAGKEIVNLGKKGSELAGLQKSFNGLVAAQSSVTITAEALFEKMRKGSRGLISDIELYKQANQAMLLGIDVSRMDELLQIAQSAAQATGQSMQFMTQSIITGLGRQSPLILDNLGITVNATKAYDDYAASIGKSASALTDSEKKTAFMNAVINTGLANMNKMKNAVEASRVAYDDYAASIGKTVDQLTMQEKAAALTAASISDSVENIERMQAAVSNTASTIMPLNLELEKMQATFDNMAAQLGKDLAPTLTVIVNRLNQMFERRGGDTTLGIAEPFLIAFRIIQTALEASARGWDAFLGYVFEKIRIFNVQLGGVGEVIKDVFSGNLERAAESWELMNYEVAALNAANMQNFQKDQAAMKKMFASLLADIRGGLKRDLDVAEKQLSSTSADFTKKLEEQSDVRAQISDKELRDTEERKKKEQDIIEKIEEDIARSKEQLAANYAKKTNEIDDRARAARILSEEDSARKYDEISERLSASARRREENLKILKENIAKQIETATVNREQKLIEIRKKLEEELIQQRKNSEQELAQVQDELQDLAAREQAARIAERQRKEEEAIRKREELELERIKNVAEEERKKAEEARVKSGQSGLQALTGVSGESSSVDVGAVGSLIGSMASGSGGGITGLVGAGASVLSGAGQIGQGVDLALKAFMQDLEIKAQLKQREADQAQYYLDLGIKQMQAAQRREMQIFEQHWEAMDQAREERQAAETKVIEDEYVSRNKQLALQLSEKLITEDQYQKQSELLEREKQEKLKELSERQKEEDIAREREKAAAMKALQDRQAADEAQAKKQAALLNYIFSVAAFRSSQQLQIAQARIQTHIGAMSAIAQGATMGPLGMAAGVAIATGIELMGAKTVGMIASTPPPMPPSELFLAQGAFVRGTQSGTQATIGEGGRSEAVLPLQDPTAMAALREGLGTGATIININGGLLDSDDFFRHVDRGLYQRAMSRQSVFVDYIEERVTGQFR